MTGPKYLHLILFTCFLVFPFANATNINSYLDAESILDTIVGDTIRISCQTLDGGLKYITPDTIWIKKVKRPKENKHYRLQWYENPKCTNFTYGSTEYIDFVYKGYRYASDTLELLLYYLDIERDVVYKIKQLNHLKCNQIEKRIRSVLHDSIFYYRDRNIAEDKFCQTTKVESCTYILNVRASNEKSIECLLTFQNNMTGYLTQDGMELNNPKFELISKEEYQAHNQKVTEILKNDSVIRLARVYDHLALHNDDKYGFEGDTMAIIKYDREPKYNYTWNTDSLDFFIAYAYGKEYTIKIDSYEQLEDKIHFLDTTDLAYLKTRRNKGYNRRKESAEIWDRKNDSIVLSDCMKDTSDIVWATLNYDTDFMQYIDVHGNRKYDYVSKPSKGTRIPICFYGDGGDMNVTFWTSYEANLFAVGIGHGELTFENDSDRLYLMRSGRRNFEERVRNAVTADVADRMVELLEQEAKKEEKIKSLSKKRIFLLSMDKAYGDYDWCGIKPRFLNCYSKTIKYIDCMVVPYNRFGDQQPDDYGRYSKEIRCVGPFEPGEIASWRFEDMFKNESGIIRSFKITNIKITFLDNSTIIYKGWENVKKHYEHVDF